MVGIARARGCGICRKRKIACGLERPTCAQCVKSKRVCTGYRKYPIFIAHQPPEKDDLEAPTLCKVDPAKASSESSYATPTDFNLPLTSPSSDVVKHDPVTSLLPGANIDSNPAFRQQLLEVYLHHHLSKIGSGPMQQRLWLVQIPGLSHATPALEASMMALCVAKMGNLCGDEGLIHESLKLYQRSLRQLQLALWDPDLMLDDQTLTACLALGMYEMSQCPDRSNHGYISHTLGCRRLVELRGPEAHVDGLGHAAFVHFRIQGILYALDQGEHTYLGDPVWQEVPWRKRSKTPYDQIYDFLTRAPELRNQGDMLQFMDPHSQLQLATEMIWNCWKMDSELDSVYQSLEKSHEGPLYWSELARNKSLHGDSKDGMLFPVAFHFANLHIANTVVMYWAVQIILWHGMWQLYHVIAELQLHFAAAAKVEDSAESPTSTSDAVSALFKFPPLQHRADFAEPCRNIFQSVEYSLQEDMLDQGPKCCAAPVRIAYESLRSYPSFSQEVAWAERAQELIQERSMMLLRYYVPRR